MRTHPRFTPIYIINKIPLLIILLIAVLISSELAFADADKIFRENNKAVVVIETYDEKGEPIGQGSGFIVRADGAIVTNYHVISNAKDIKIKAGNKVLDVKGLIHMDKENDIVILKADVKGLPTVRLGDIEKANVGEKVYVISSPQGLENTISDGILSGIREITPERKVLQITAPISPGSSGGPVFNKNGEVIGIATFLIEEAQNLNFAMPVNLIKDKIGRGKVTALKDAEIEDYKETAEYWFVLGYYFGEAGMYKEAMEANKQAIRIKPDIAEAHFNLGLAYYNLGMYKEAIEANKQSIKIKPDDKYAHNNLGLAYDNLSMYKEAIEAFKQAIRIDPDYADAHYNLGFAYGILGMYREAMEEYKQAIRIDPDDAGAHYNLGFAYGILGMYREAIDALKQAIRIKPDHAQAHFAHSGLGFAYSNLGMYREAIDAFKQAIRIKPDYAIAHSGLGDAYYGLGMYREAMEEYKQAIRIDPDDAGAHYNLGLAYLIIDNRGMALEEYKILKELDAQKAEELFNLIYK